MISQLVILLSSDRKNIKKCWKSKIFVGYMNITKPIIVTQKKTSYVSYINKLLIPFLKIFCQNIYI